MLSFSTKDLYGSGSNLRSYPNQFRDLEVDLLPRGSGAMVYLRVATGSFRWPIAGSPEDDFTLTTGGDNLLSMKATNWEFTNRALVFGLIFAFTFPLHSFDHQNSTAVLANWLAPRLRTDADLVARVLFAFAALLLTTAALIRTWASSYLHAGVVYAAQVKTESLVADGPYRRVRNPLYFANVLMAIGMGALMSRTGSLVAILAMLLFCYRLILREEAELQASQGEQYQAYRKAVPRFWPCVWPRIAAAGRQANWTAGLKAESWYWGFAAAVVAFALSLKLKLFFVILGVSIVLFWASSLILQKKPNSPAPGSPE